MTWRSRTPFELVKEIGNGPNCVHHLNDMHLSRGLAFAITENIGRGGYIYVGPRLFPRKWS